MIQESLWGRLFGTRTLKEPQPETSRMAYDALDLGNEQQLALRAIKATGARGLTADELEQHTGRGHQRICELRRKGVIMRAGIRRRTRAGRLAEVYVAR